MQQTVVITDAAAIKKSYTRNILLIGLFFFIFGFTTWVNATLIQYLRIACELKEWEAYLVTFAFYISYTIMAIPSSAVLRRTGMVKGMSIGLAVMGIGCLIFIPAALTRMYALFLLGLIFVGGGLTLLQTAVNPYITMLGPAESAAKRISIMGICNKTAGILAPLIMGAIILKNSDKLVEQLKAMDPAAKLARLNELARDVIVPYLVLAGILFLIAFLIRFAHLPELNADSETEKEGAVAISKSSIDWQYALGFIAIFAATGAEVLTGDSIGSYGESKGFALDTAKNFASFPLAGMMLGYLAGVALIPKIISQQKAFYYSSWLGLVLVMATLVLPGTGSLIALACLGFANAMLWPAIWPQALDGLTGRALGRGSAILIMGIAGAAIVPLIYAGLIKVIGHQYAYAVLLPVYIFLLYYSFKGLRKVAVS